MVYIFVFLLMMHTFFYYRRHVYVPKTFSKHPVIRAMGFKRVYPHYLLPFGFVQSVYQLFRRIRIVRGAKHASVILAVSSDADVYIDIYEMAQDAGPAGGAHAADHAALVQVRLTKGAPLSTGAAAEKPPEARACAPPIRHNVLLIHGLNGTSRSTYIKGMANVFLKKNCRVFCYNARGALIPPRSNLFSHIGLTSDIKATVEHILANYPGYVSLVGFSMGSNWVAKFLGEYSHERVIMGVSVCCPFDFNYLKQYYGSTSLYARFINYSMSRNYKRYLRRSMQKPLNLSHCRFLEDIDRALLQIYQTEELDDFYRENSCITYLHKISTPMLFINTIDDPVIPHTVIPFETCLANPNLGIVMLKGGHLGFFTNGRETMAETVVSEFFTKLVGSLDLG
ncbi:hypothetical protein PAPHI01_1684 [Pancytospora philotis]|nr:hypothetical protein PAPHI01_1684 [Pancytospora philotis]